MIYLNMHLQLDYTRKSAEFQKLGQVINSRSVSKSTVQGKGG